MGSRCPTCQTVFATHSQGVSEVLGGNSVIPCVVDTPHLPLHSMGVGMLPRRIAVTALVVFLSAGNKGLCAGWEATAEARMACCVEGSCPMHSSSERGSDSTRALTQADADRCCAASETPNPTPTGPVFALALPPATLVHQLFAVGPPFAVAFAAAREPVPLVSHPVPKHLLLSVFLI